MSGKKLPNPACVRKKGREVDVRIKKIVTRVNLMRDLLFEIKADTPLGKTVTALLNLFLYEGEGEVWDLTGISYQKLADSIGISRAELLESLESLQQQGIIEYKKSSRD